MGDFKTFSIFGIESKVVHLFVRFRVGLKCSCIFHRTVLDSKIPNYYLNFLYRTKVQL